MALTAVSPVSGSLINPGDDISFTIDDTYTTLQIEVVVTAGTEYAYDLALGGGQGGYTVQVVDNGATKTFTFSRNAGFDLSPVVIRVIENETGSTATTSLTYDLVVTTLFPRGMQPYDPTLEGSLIVSEDDTLVRSDVSHIDVVGAVLTDEGNGKVKIDVTAGVAGVASFEARTGAVISNAGDYNSSEITNVSGVVGASVGAALDTLLSDKAIDTDVFHDNVDGEIAALTEKTVPANDDLFVINDSAASNALKKIKFSNIVSGASPVSSVFGRTGAIAATAGDYTATKITNTPAGNIAAVTVQAALDELDGDKIPGLVSATDNALARFDGTTGKLLQDGSNATLDDNGHLALTGSSVALQLAERATAPANETARGHFWVKDDAPTTPWFTDDVTGDYKLGDTVGPASSTDNAIARFDSTTGKLLQDSSTSTLSDNSALDLTGSEAEVRMVEQASVADPTASYGRWWVKNDAPSRPRFTDDTNVTHHFQSASQIIPGVAWTANDLVNWVGMPQATSPYTNSWTDTYGVVGADPVLDGVYTYSYAAPFNGVITDMHVFYRIGSAIAAGEIWMWRVRPTWGAATLTYSGVQVGTVAAGRDVTYSYKASYTTPMTIELGDHLCMLYKGTAAAAVSYFARVVVNMVRTD